MKCLGFVPSASGNGSSTRLPPLCDRDSGAGFLCTGCANICVTRGAWSAALGTVEAEPFVIVQNKARRDHVAVLPWNNGRPRRNQRAHAPDLVNRRYGSFIKDPHCKWPCFFVAGKGRPTFIESRGVSKRGLTDVVPLVKLSQEKPEATARLLDGEPVLPAREAQKVLSRLARVDEKDNGNASGPIAAAAEVKASPRNPGAGDPLRPGAYRFVPDPGMEDRVVDKAFDKVSSKLDEMNRAVMAQIRTEDRRGDSRGIDSILKKFNRGKTEVEAAVSSIQRDNAHLREQVQKLFGIANVLKRKIEAVEGQVAGVDERVVDLEEVAGPGLQAKVSRLDDEVIPDIWKKIDSLHILFNRLRK
eukprot:jgi/Tetstr1/447313/TSEL_034750.t1